MKNPTSGVRMQGDADAEGIRPTSASIPFRIVRCVPCEYGAKKAEASIEIEGLGSIEVDYFAPANGRPPFAIARSIRSKYTGEYVRVVRLDDAFAAAVREAIEARLFVDGRAE